MVVTVKVKVQHKGRPTRLLAHRSERFFAPTTAYVVGEDVHGAPGDRNEEFSFVQCRKGSRHGTNGLEPLPCRKRGSRNATTFEIPVGP